MPGNFRSTAGAVHDKKLAGALGDLATGISKVRFEVAGFWAAVDADASANQNNDCGQVASSAQQAMEAESRVANVFNTAYANARRSVYKLLHAPRP